jgi:flagellar basal body-associated protein FliL
MKWFDSKKIFKRFTQLRDNDKLKMEITPRKDWQLLVVFFVVLAVIVAATSFYIFVHIENDEIFLAKGEDRPALKVFNAAKLKNIIQTLRSREEDLANLKANRPHVVDPSL